MDLLDEAIDELILLPDFLDEEFNNISENERLESDDADLSDEAHGNLSPHSFSLHEV